MMEEAEYIAQLESLWPQDGETEASLDAIKLADEAVLAHPLSARLWCIRGDLIQLGPEENPHELDEALSSYQRAISVDPNFIEAYEEIAHFLDAVKCNTAEAQRYLEEANSIMASHRKICRENHRPR